MKINIAELRRKCESLPAIFVASVDVKKMCDILEAASLYMSLGTETVDINCTRELMEEYENAGQRLAKHVAHVVIDDEN